MIRIITRGRRLLRKRMYKAPHTRHRNSQYYRENRNLAKPHQEAFKKVHAPRIKRKKRPKREVEGYKMSYRFKMYGNVDEIVEEDEIEESSQ